MTAHLLIVPNDQNLATGSTVAALAMVGWLTNAAHGQGSGVTTRAPWQSKGRDAAPVGTAPADTPEVHRV